MANHKQYSEFVNKVCELSGCERSIVFTKCRKTEVVRARKLIISYRVKVMCLTQEKATSVFDMDHSSVPSTLKVVKNDYDTNSNYRNIFSGVFEEFPQLNPQSWKLQAGRKQ